LRPIELVHLAFEVAGEPVAINVICHADAAVAYPTRNESRPSGIGTLNTPVLCIFIKFSSNTLHISSLNFEWEYFIVVDMVAIGRGICGHLFSH
jgi:hypothetical protein